MHTGIKLSSALILAGLLTACDVMGGISVGEGQNLSDKDMETVMGGIDVGNNAQAGDLSTVNGGINVGSDSEVGELVTVNGGIRIGPNSRAASVETVNGGIDLASGVQVKRDVATVNGPIELSQGVHVSGDLGNVNGGVLLTAATVDGDFKSVNGEVQVLEGSKIAGRFEVGEKSRWSGKQRKPIKVVIGENSEVGGPLIFEGEVELWVHQTATIGTVEGADAKRFSGDRPEYD